MKECLVDRTNPIGEQGVGKTCMIQRFLFNRDGSVYAPCVMGNFAHVYTIQDERIYLDVEESPGREFSTDIAQLIYNEIDCFICCYSVVDVESVRALAEHWIPQIQEFVARDDVKLIFCGTKADLIGMVDKENYVSVQRVKRIVNSNAEVFEVSSRDESLLDATLKGCLSEMFDRSIFIGYSKRYLGEAMQSRRKCFLS